MNVKPLDQGVVREKEVFNVKQKASNPVVSKFWDNSGFLPKTKISVIKSDIINFRTIKR
jgi:hypothetical protein